MVRQQQRILKGQKQMTGQVKVQWDMSLPEDQSENGRNIGSWTAQENLLYAIFINQNKSTMVSKKKRKNCRVFDRMADFIVSRNSLQCRSHHQKLIEKFSQIKTIIQVFKKYFGNQYFREQSQLHANKERPIFTNGQELKNQENANTPDFIEQPVQQKESGGVSVESEVKSVEPVRTEDEQRQSLVEGQCKMEQLLQYYCPANFYIGGNLVQIPFFNGFYQTFVYQ